MNGYWTQVSSTEVNEMSHCTGVETIITATFQTLEIPAANHARGVAKVVLARSNRLVIPSDIHASTPPPSSPAT